MKKKRHFFRYDKSVKWMTSFVTGFIENTAIIQPLRIAFVAAVVTCFTKTKAEPSENVTFQQNLKLGNKISSIDTKMLNSLIVKRNFYQIYTCFFFLSFLNW